MLHRLLITFILISNLTSAHAPLPLWRWSEIHFDFKSKTDSITLVDSYKQAWLTYGMTDTSFFHSGEYGMHSFDRWRVLDKNERSILFDPENIGKASFIGKAELISAWSPQFDSFMVYSYEPLCVERILVDPMGNGYSDTSAWVHCPFRTYRDFVPATKYNLIANQLLNNLAGMLGGTLVHDTIFRVVRFTCDSNEYLPHATYREFAYELSGMFYYKVTPYRNKECGFELNKQQYDKVGSKWDSTNYVADPNIPGTWIMAPIKYLVPSKAFMIYECWIPDTIALPELESRVKLKPYVRYTRHVISYGQLTTGGMAWGKAEQVEAELKMIEGFDWNAYLQCFKAERFLRSQVRGRW